MTFASMGKACRPLNRLGPVRKNRSFRMTYNPVAGEARLALRLWQNRRIQHGHPKRLKKPARVQESPP
jgi:hypothetical protein